MPVGITSVDDLGQLLGQDGACAGEAVPGGVALAPGAAAFAGRVPWRNFRFPPEPK